MGRRFPWFLSTGCQSRRPWARLSANRLARRHNETVVQRGKDFAARPRIEIALHLRVGRKVLGQLPPLATGGRNVEDRIYHPFAGLLRADARELKLLAEAAPSQTTRHPSYRFHIASPRVYNVNECFRPDHRTLPRIFANPKNHNFSVRL
jgi:hypothetical protein